jgi:hypothetical protein
MSIKRILSVAVFITVTVCSVVQSQTVIDKQFDYSDEDVDSVYSAFSGTNIQMRMPKYFEEFNSESINGYMHKGTAASIVAFEYDSPYVLVNDTLTQESLKSQNVDLVGSEETKTYTGMPGKFYFVRFNVDNVEVIRIMFFTGSYNETVFLQANYPFAFDSLLRKVIMESFRTVKFD